MKAIFCIVAVSFLFSISAFLFADTITLRNGGKLHGKVIKESEEEIVLQVADAATITLRKRDVVSAEKDETVATPPPPSRVIEEEKPEPAKEPPKKPAVKEEPAPEEVPKTEKEPEPDPELKAKIDLHIAQLANRKAGQRNYAKAELAKIGKPAVSALIQTLKQGTPWQRQAAAELLGAIGDERAIEPLIDALQDEDEFVRQNAINSLSTLTNQTFGFVHDAPESERQEAVKKWQDWLAQKKEEAKKKEEEKRKQEEKKKSEETKPESPAPK